MSTKTISLHCPSRNLTISAFVISPFQKLDQVLQGVRLALDIPYAAIYTVDAKRVTDPQSLDDGQRVLVAVDEDEEMLPDAQERGCVIYLGEDEEMWEVGYFYLVFFLFFLPVVLFNCFVLGEVSANASPSAFYLLFVYLFIFLFAAFELSW